MASVKSLGLHHPSGLRHAVEENLIPASAPASSYTWDITTDERGEHPVEDELLTTQDCVVWCRGRIFRKTFKFSLEKEPITQALLAYFPTSEDQKSDRGAAKNASNGSPALEKALVVFLKTQAHIYFLAGTSHVVHMPFEVESACAGPVGVIIQRKARVENIAPVSLKFPRVPPNSFVSSQTTAFAGSQQTAFSVEGLGNPKALHLGLRSTLEHMWDAPMEQPESHWPRLLSLTDPLWDIGLVVTDSDPHNHRGARSAASRKPAFLDPAEEMLHVEQIHLPVASAKQAQEPLILGVTINRESSTYTVWQLTYLSHEDPFIGHHKKAKNKTRRRSSMQPGFVSSASTPVQQNFRESFGAPLPGKRQRKSEKIDKPLDLVSSLEQQDREGAGVTRRSSRRLSSMLARADLSASHERSVFAEQPLIPNSGASKRHEAHSHHHGRSSSSFHHPIHPSLGSLLEAPIDVGLDEGLHNMGLEDYDFDGLQHEIRFARLHTISLDNSNVRYSTSAQPARNQSKVFILTAPSFTVDEQQRTQLLIGIQDSLEKRLQLITMHVRVQEKFGHVTASVVPREQWKVQNVVDSSKLVDGDLSVILVLSESMDGRHELSTQAPWIELTKISLSLLLVDDTRSIQYRGRVADRDVEQRKSEFMDLSNGSIVGIRYPRQRGVVDVLDADGRLHQLKIQLQPSCPQVRRVLDVCRSVLPDSLGGRIHAGWIHVMQWLSSQEESVANMEWSAFATLLLASFLNLGRPESNAFKTTRLPVRKRRPASGSFGSIRESEDWRVLEMRETANAIGCPVWMMNRGWQWALDDADDASSAPSDQSFAPNFLPRHIAFAKEYLASPLGEAAMGPSGYMPTALGKNSDGRRKVAVDVFMALHLLLEEQKLDITTPECLSPGRADLRVLLCQIASWLKWHSFSSIYELGIQEDLDQRHDADLNLKSTVPQPPVRPDVFEWIQSRLVGVRGKPCLTPADIYYASSRLSEAEKLKDKRWDAITPRTLMFKRFFKFVKPKTTAVQMVEAMRDCGLTNHVLETLPEAILAPLQDAISLCQPHPPSEWTHDLLELVKRSDISLILTPKKRPRLAMSSILAPTHSATWDFRLLCQSVEETNNLGYDEGEGTERQAVIRALFKDDRRLNEAQDLLSTHKARLVHLEPSPSWPESEYLEKQKELVSRIATGTLAIPAGRALLYYSLRYPLITQKFHIGGFNLNCIVKPTNVTVGVDKTLFTEEKVCWGFFHQGVAAGLAISPQAKGIDTSWILYNKPGQDLSNRHAGFLLALGLNGHLKGVAKWVAFKYLTTKHTMTSIGLLLGLAASYMGTMDSLITRLLSVHATRMLPRGAAELNLSPLTQTSGIMGIGLLYCKSQHRRMSEIMLSEIEHVDDEDEEEPLRSECYRLAAGFALGFINLGKGNDLKGLHDMRLTEKLIAHATATKNVEIVHILDRAAAGAVMAIAFIFMKSEDQIVARKIDIPDSVLQFDYVRPDILLLRTVTKNLILWSKIEPTFAWIRDGLPVPYRPRYKLMGMSKLRSTDLPFFSILTGICFSIALRFSGSASTKVRDLLLHYLDQFMRISRIPSTPRAPPDAAPMYDEELARSNARMCQDILALSCSIVMAGTGDIPVLRRLRALHGRDDPETPYGSHLAAHLAIGALFLGCGTATFGSSNMAIAALLVAFYPVFPVNVMDNRSHLQAFRYFWVLAAEQRCLVAKDVLTGQPVSVSVQIAMRPGESAEPVLYKTTPCLLPPLDQIASLSTSCGPQYWDVELNFANDDIREAFSETQSLYLRRRPPREGPFTSTLRALGKDAKGENPLEWVFGLDGLRSVTSAEKAALLESTEREPEVGAALDARMELERGIADGGDRERLEGARLLFEWGSARDRLLDSSATAGANDSQSTIKPTTADSQPGQESPPAQRDENVWWMRDSAIESLKGQVWLAARDGGEL
ncbi:Negative regulator of mitosis [Tolypocladium capitatum]|uniref:Negative regulator of mitosis n=1 Tax=Tolypocladium capitatum TaxID=45235 RepID=A0A2K3QMX1_9HYPO|nr:Negative regulator of mitosis [Tolypocladium capitatum]